VGIVAIALVVGLLFGAALVAFVGARRSSSALGRFIAFNHPADVEVIAAGHDADLDLVDALPDVQASAEAVFLFFVPTDDEGVAQPQEIGAIAPFAIILKAGDIHDLERPRVLRGREADPAAPLETTINEELASTRHLDVGSTLRVVALSPAQVGTDSSGVDGLVPLGPALAFQVVGVTRTPADLNPAAARQDVIYQGSPEMRLGRAFWERYGDQIGVAEAPDVFRAIRLRNPAGFAAFEAHVRALPHGDEILLQQRTSDSEVNSSLAKDAIGLESASLLLLGAVLAGAGLLLVRGWLAHHLREGKGSQK